MKKNANVIFVIGTILVCTIFLTHQHDRARKDRGRLFQDLIEQSWRIQTDLNGVWEESSTGVFQRMMPAETDQTIRMYLIDAAKREEVTQQLLLDLTARLEKLEAGG